VTFWKLQFRRRKANNPVLKNGGFTLLEISIAVALLGVALSIAVPNMQKPYGRYQLQVAARQLVSDIRYLEQLAQSKESNIYKITFDVGNDRYYLQEGVNTLPSGQKGLPENVDLYLTNFAGNVLMMEQDGSTTSGHIQLRSKVRAGDLYIIIYQHTGRVRISNQPP